MQKTHPWPVVLPVSEGAGIVESDFVPKKTRALAQGKINTTVHGDGLVIAGRPFHFIPGHRISEI